MLSFNVTVHLELSEWKCNNTDNKLYLQRKGMYNYPLFFFFLNNFIYKTITYTTYSINYTYIVLATNTTDTYTYTNYAYTTLRYMYYNTININLIYGWRVYKVLFN